MFNKRICSRLTTLTFQNGPPPYLTPSRPQGADFGRNNRPKSCYDGRPVVGLGARGDVVALLERAVVLALASRHCPCVSWSCSFLCSGIDRRHPPPNLSVCGKDTRNLPFNPVPCSQGLNARESCICLWTSHLQSTVKKIFNLPPCRGKEKCDTIRTTFE